MSNAMRSFSYGALAAVLAASSAVAGCNSVARGMYRHEPERVWKMSSGTSPADVPQAAPRGPAVVIQRFEDRSLNPVGGLFNGASPENESLLEGYSASMSLAAPLYSGTVAKLTTAGYAVWTDHLLGPSKPVAPEGVEDYVVVSGALEHLEVHAFVDDGRVDEAAWASLTFRVWQPESGKIVEFPVEFRAKRQQGTGDVLDDLSSEIAAALATRINKGV